MGRGAREIRTGIGGLAALAGIWFPLGHPAQAQSLQDLRAMSISDLANVDISSVSKTPQSLSDAAAAIYVISHEDIIRSGATILPEILRLAPNLQVAQTSASQYVITARGMSGNSAAQSYANKLLVLIDGRSVYTPLYSGVYWDMQDVLPEDIDRIEVISGPGATLWGANAVNGVINIITRKPAETRGAFVSVQAGGLEQSASARYGGAIGDSLHYRLYARAFADDQTRTSTGTPAQDDWSRFQGGFRVDWTPATRDTLTLQGDAYWGTESQLGAPDEQIAGRNLLARWNHSGVGGSALQIQAYYDRTERLTEDAGGHYTLDTYDLDLQHSLALDGHNKLVWGGGLRVSHYDIIGTDTFYFQPRRNTLALGNLFAQDTLSLGASLHLTVGLKLENDPYSGFSLLPSGRLSWKVGPRALLWGAISRAVRSPTPFDEDVVEKLGPTVFLTGASDFRTEKLTAYEAGARFQPSADLSFSISGFYNVYDDLRSIEITPVTFLPLRWGNMLEGHSYGVEAWGAYNVTSWWKLSAGFNLLREHFRFAPGASGLLGVSQVGDDPRHQASLRSSMNLGSGLRLDADLRAVGDRPDPHVRAYTELNGHFAWAVSRHIELSVSGFNLLHARHLEYPAPSNPVPRKVLAGVRWRF